MTGWVVISRTARGYRLRHQSHKPADAAVVDLDEKMLECGVNDTVSRLVSRIGNSLWALEIAKYAAQNLAVPLGAGFALSNAAATGKHAVIAARPHDPGLVMRVAAFELASQGHHVGHRGLRLAKETARFLAGAIAGSAAWLTTLLRFPAKHTPIPDSDVVIAIYGEQTNRTRHLLPPAYRCGPHPVFLIVGRARGTLDDVARAIDPSQQIAGKRLFRAIGWWAAATSLPRAIGIMASGLRLSQTSPVHLPVREYAAITFRVLQGACEAKWWRKYGPRPKTVLFGLTGLADTTQLELAMQETGSKTVHCVHGVSLGWNFAAHSDVGLFVCGHDAKLARRFPGYRRTLHIPARPPQFIAGEREWIVLTSHAHPMNAHLPACGIDLDRSVLGIVAKAANTLQQNSAEVVWKPHPALASLPAHLSQALEAYAVTKGFRRWKDSDAFADIARYHVVISTTSTAALEAMRLGKLPILLAARAVPQDIVYAQLPLFADNIQDLCDCIRSLDKEPAVLLAKAWHSVQLGEKITNCGLVSAGIIT